VENNMAFNIILVIVGGGIGSASRYLLTLLAARLFGSSFPLGTLGVNLGGCLLIGLGFAFTFSEVGRKHKELIEHIKAKTASEIMKKNIITINEEAAVDDAIRFMTEKGLKRLPVVDGNGVFKGMISRDSVLRLIYY
jgi:CBS domain-containing protein